MLEPEGCGDVEPERVEDADDVDVDEDFDPEVDRVAVGFGKSWDLVDFDVEVLVLGSVVAPPPASDPLPSIDEAHPATTNATIAKPAAAPRARTRVSRTGAALIVSPVVLGLGCRR
ncbi:MAG: hypothetical protein JWN61_1080 [Pseudonocardiales bacterium]|nr:hypothetical protein [Pseudonocardiales bacterium]